MHFLTRGEFRPFPRCAWLFALLPQVFNNSFFSLFTSLKSFDLF